MSLRDKMLAVIDDVNGSVAEREELVEMIAIALLTRKNLFVLGEPGQAKSMPSIFFAGTSPARGSLSACSPSRAMRNSFSDVWIYPASFRAVFRTRRWRTMRYIKACVSTSSAR